MDSLLCKRIYNNCLLLNVLPPKRNMYIPSRVWLVSVLANEAMFVSCLWWHNETSTFDLISRRQKKKRKYGARQRDENVTAAEKFPLRALSLSLVNAHKSRYRFALWSISNSYLRERQLNKLYRNERDLGRGYTSHYHSLIISGRASVTFLVLKSSLPLCHDCQELPRVYGESLRAC